MAAAEVLERGNAVILDLDTVGSVNIGGNEGKFGVAGECERLTPMRAARYTSQYWSTFGMTLREVILTDMIAYVDE